MRVGHTVFCGSDSRALIEQNWAWLELRVRVFGLRVSVLSVHDPLKANVSLLSRCVCSRLRYFIGFKVLYMLSNEDFPF